MLFNPSGGDDPLQARLVWVAATLDPSPALDGHVTGVSDLSEAGQPSSTENDRELGQSTRFPGGLCPGRLGEFWYVDTTDPFGLAAPALRLYRGVFDVRTGDVQWSPPVSVSLPPRVEDGLVPLEAANIAFSPDGEIGWAAFLGDLPEGASGGRSPVFLRSEDGGQTWGPPREVDLNRVDGRGRPAPLAAQLGELLPGATPFRGLR